MRISRTRHRLMISAAAVALLGGTAARAADLSTFPPPPAPVEKGCHHQGLVAGAIGGSHFSPDPELDPEFFADYKAFDYQVEGAWLGTCDHLNFQLDASLTGYYLDKNPIMKTPANRYAGHAGGIGFWRDPLRGLVGVDASYLGVRLGGNGLEGKTLSGFRVGLRGEFFASDTVTVGGRAGYFDLDEGLTGFEGDIFARYYANDNLALTARGEGLWMDRIDYPPIDIFGIGFTAGAEYLVQDTSLSLFAEGSYFHWEYSTPGPTLRVSGLRGMVGAKFYIGTQHTRLVDIHRNGPLENTSFWWEKAHGAVGAVVPSVLEGF